MHGDGVSMGKKTLKSSAEIIEWRLTVHKPILGTSAIADWKPGASAAVIGKLVPFIIPKTDLNRKFYKVPKVAGFNVSDAVFWVNIVVAGIDTAIHLHDEGAAARWGHPAKSGGAPGPYPGGLGEELYI